MCCLKSYIILNKGFCDENLNFMYQENEESFDGKMSNTENRMLH